MAVRCRNLRGPLAVLTVFNVMKLPSKTADLPISAEMSVDLLKLCIAS